MTKRRISSLKGWTLYGAFGLRPIPKRLFWVLKHIPPSDLRKLPPNTFLGIGPDMEDEPTQIALVKLTSKPEITSLRRR